MKSRPSAESGLASPKRKILGEYGSFCMKASTSLGEGRGIVKSGMASLAHCANASASATSPSYVSGSESSFSEPCGKSTAATHFLDLDSSFPSVPVSSGAYFATSAAASGADALTSMSDTRPFTPLMADFASVRETSTHSRSPRRVKTTTVTGLGLSTCSWNLSGVTAGKSDSSSLGPLLAPSPAFTFALPPRGSMTSGASSSGAAAAWVSIKSASAAGFISPSCAIGACAASFLNARSAGGSIAVVSKPDAPPRTSSTFDACTSTNAARARKRRASDLKSDPVVSLPVMSTAIGRSPASARAVAKASASTTRVTRSSGSKPAANSAIRLCELVLLRYSTPIFSVFFVYGLSVLCAG
mmetsp:Transcript_9180/g.41788  ORF Transcript_9180/g.41788 Transcript_9180/m.41788 type:complete len:357 (+) Transcript_9180:3717-4787(+)